MFQIAPGQVESRIEEQRRFDEKMESLLAGLDVVILEIGRQQSLEEFAVYLRSICRRMEEQLQCAKELTLALERIRYRYEECEYAVWSSAEDEDADAARPGGEFVCEELAQPEHGWESIWELVASVEWEDRTSPALVREERWAYGNFIYRSEHTESGTGQAGNFAAGRGGSSEPERTFGNS